MQTLTAAYVPQGQAIALTSEIFKFGFSMRKKGVMLARYEGVRGFYKGLIPNLLRFVMKIYFFCKVMYSLEILLLHSAESRRPRASPS